MKNKKQLQFNHVVRCDEHVRSFSDRRKIVDRYIVSYTDGADEYRRSFEVKPMEIFDAPKIVSL